MIKLKHIAVIALLSSSIVVSNMAEAAIKLGSYIGNWTATTNYVAGDVVTYNHNTYLSLVGANKNKNPATVITAWQILGTDGVGIVGTPGPQGATGLQGATGPKGDKGDIGPQGPAGIQGPIGITGPQGIQGVAPTCTPYYYGEIGPAGGKIFYLDGTGCHGLEAQPYDVGANDGNLFVGVKLLWAEAITASATYNNSNDPITGTNGFNCSTTNAQLTPYCWHLPSKSELQYLYDQKDVVGGYVFDNYWSSSQISSNQAWYQSLGYGTQDYTIRDSRLVVRAVRAF